MTTKIVELILIYLFLTTFNVDGFLPKLNLPMIMDVINRTCVVLAIESDLENEAQIDDYTDLLAILNERAFVDDENIIFGKSTYSDLFYDSKIKIKTQPPLIDNNIDVQILVLDRKLPDRSCLLTNGLMYKELKGGTYKGRSDLETLLNFINTRCGTFRNFDGTLNDKGLGRESILKNFYSISSSNEEENGSKSNMKTIFDQCHDRDGRLKEFFYDGKCRQSKIMELPKCETIDGRTLTKEEFFVNYLSRSKPVVIKNLLKSNWPNSNEWTNEFFRQNFGQQRIHIKLTPTGEFEGVEDARLWKNCRTDLLLDDQFCTSPISDVPAEVKKHLIFSKDLVMVRPADTEMTMQEFIDLIENRTAYGGYRGNLSAYLEYTPVGENFVGFDEALPEMPFMEDLLKLDLLNMWLSNGNTLGKLHFDQYDNLLCQVSGKKRVILFDPHNNTRLYEGHIVEAKLSFQNGTFNRNGIMENTALTMSSVDMEKPNFDRFPEFANAIPLNCTIEAGDILFIPSFWWHEVQSYPDQQLKRNLAFNFWYEPFLWKEFPCIDCKLDINSLYRHLL